MKIKTLLIGTGIVLLLLLLTCNAGRISQYFKDKENATSTALTDSIATARQELNRLTAENNHLRQENAQVSKSTDSIIKYSQTTQNRVKTAIYTNNTKVINLSDKERNNIIDSLQTLDGAEMLKDYLNKQLADSLYMLCQKQNDALTNDLDLCKKVLVSDKQVMDAADKLDKAQVKMIDHEATQVKKHKVKDFFAKTGAFILGGIATIETTALAIIKYSPK